jgi:hypothetical protein
LQAKAPRSDPSLGSAPDLDPSWLMPLGGIFSRDLKDGREELRGYAHIDGAAKRDEDRRQSDEAKGRQAAIFESRDRRLIDAAESLEMSLCVAQSQARRLDDDTEVGEGGRVAD